jgi:hypothetical protein
LSFHSPAAAPVYDSLASHWAKVLVPEIEEAPVDERVRDHVYGCHCLRALWLLESLQKACVKRPKLRVVDFVLYDALIESATS